MHTQKTWILLINGSLAKIYDYIYRDQQLTLIKEFSSEEAHLTSAKLGKDKPGRSQESIVGSRHAIEPKMDIHKKEKLVFIHQVIDYLNHAANNKNFDQLIICAAAETLGHLRKLTNKQTNSLIFNEINKDLTHLTKNEILEHIRQQ